MQHKVAIQADGNAQIGMGHISRCISIAEALRKFDVQPIFLLSDKYACKVMDENQIDYCVLGTDYRKIDEDIDLVHHFVIEKQISCILVDSYFASNQYLNALKNFVHVACIDGLYKYDAEVDILINYNAAATFDFYNERFAGKATELLVGCDYTPLKSAFWNVKDVCGKAYGNKVLITTGSTDPFNICGQFLYACQQMGLLNKLEITIVIGNFFQYKSTLLGEWESFDNINFVQDCSNLMPFMRDTNVAISAAGTTVYELLRMEVPTILFAMTDIQLTAEALSSNVLWIGDIRDESSVNKLRQDKLNMIVTCLEKVCFSDKDYDSLKSKCCGVIDGKGSIRIAEHIIELA